MRLSDEEKYKLDKEAKNQESLNKYIEDIALRSNLLDYEFIKKRYEHLSTIKKTEAK